MNLAGRFAVAGAVFLLGATSAFAGLFVHRAWWGCALVWAVALVVMVALPREWFGRAAFALGWTGLLAMALQTRPEGDYMVAGDLWGYLLLATSPLLMVGAVVGAFGGPRTPAERPTEAQGLAGLDAPS